MIRSLVPHKVENFQYQDVPRRRGAAGLSLKLCKPERGPLIPTSQVSLKLSHTPKRDASCFLTLKST